MKYTLFFVKITFPNVFYNFSKIHYELNVRHDCGLHHIPQYSKVRDCLGHRFGAWLQKAHYFAKHFWNKPPDEIIGVGEDMKNSYCSTLGEYIEKGMNAQTLSQIKETREIKERVSQVKKKSRSRDDGWEW